MKSITILLLIILPSLVFSVSKNNINLEELKSTTTIVILKNDNDELNNTLKKVLDKEWNYTSLIYIDETTFISNVKKYINNNKDYSFFTIKERHATLHDTRQLLLSMDVNEKGIYPTLKLKNLCMAWADTHIDHTSLEAEFTKLINYIKTSVFNKQSFINKMGTKDFTLTFPKHLITAPLHLPKEAFGKKWTIKKIQRYYSGEIILVSKDELSQAIINKKEDFFYYDHFTTTTSSSYGYIVNAHTGEPIYIAYGPGATITNEHMGTLMGMGRALYKMKKQLKKNAK